MNTNKTTKHQQTTHQKKKEKREGGRKKKKERRRGRREGRRRQEVEKGKREGEPVTRAWPGQPDMGFEPTWSKLNIISPASHIGKCTCTYAHAEPSK